MQKSTKKYDTIYINNSLIGVLVGIVNSVVKIRISVITTVINKYKSKKKKKNKHDKTVLPAKLNTVKVLIFKVFNDSSISHDEFVSVNNVLK